MHLHFLSCRRNHDKDDQLYNNTLQSYFNRFLKSRGERAALVNNFMRKLSFDEFDGCPSAVQNGMQS